MIFDRARLGCWADLPFFETELPALTERLSAETAPIYPVRRNIFRALELCQPQDTRVLILGQDPYHTAGKADGLAFSIPAEFGGKLDSLGNIFTELKSDLGVERTRTDLTDWAEQGVLLLNTALTVIEGKANAHKSIGWRSLIDQVLNHLDQQPCVLMLWGRPAQKLGKTLTHPEHLRLETAHPSPLSVYRGFYGSRPFSQANAWLADRGQSEIHWA